MTVDMLVNPLSPKGSKATPPRVKNTTGNSDQSKNISPISNSNSGLATNNRDNRNTNSDNEDGFKKSSTDDVLTEEDTDDEEQDKIFLGLAHESNDVPNLLNNDVNGKSNLNLEQYDYNGYSTAHLDKIYHPTSSIFEDNKKDDNNHHQPGFFNGNDTTTSFLTPRFSTAEDNTFLQDTSTIYQRATFNRRPSQLQYEMSSNMNALGPPSHVLKARRLSKNVVHSSSSSTPITPVKSLSTNSITIKDKRKPSIVNNYSKEFSDSNNSAVSPRFMALRKLSEVTTLPSHSISFSAVPPVPQIPATYHNVAADDHTNASSESAHKSMTTSDNENRILARIDDIIETQLQFHLGQVIWRASESHLEARKFWEEQKKEMFGFAATLVDRMEAQEDMTRRMTLGSLTPDESTDKQKETNLDSLKRDITLYKSNLEKQLIEIESLKAKKSELEKQHEIDVISMSKQWEDKDATLRRLKELELSASNAKKPKNVQIANLEAENKQLKLQMKKIEKVNRQLVEEASNLKLDITSRDQEIKQMKNQLIELKSTYNNRRKASTSTTGASENNKNCKNSENWADIMESEDEAKKSAEEWASKYRELQASYFEVCLQLEKMKKNDDPSDDEKKIFDLGQTIIAKNEEIRHLKQAENVNRIQMEYMQKELDKYQRSSSPLTDVEEKSKQKLYRANKRKSQHRKSTPVLGREKEPLLQEVAPKNKNNNTTEISNSDRPVTPQKIFEEKTKPEQKPLPQQANKVREQLSIETKNSDSNSEYVTENGYLTFTTEINGVLSNYSIKLPTGYYQPAKNSQPKSTMTNVGNTPRKNVQDVPTQSPKEKKNKLNPNAAVWKA